jgi:thiamine-phosphate pyrophosphorylase
MELVVLSTPGQWKQDGVARTVAEEVHLVNELFDAGLSSFHLRKPMFSVAELKNWLSLVKPEHLQRISLHTFHDLVYDFQIGGIHTSERQRQASDQGRHQQEFLLEQFPALRLSSSFHTLSDLQFAPKIYDYTFISPVFDSISRPHYRAAFAREDVMEMLSHARNKVVALGGVTYERLPEVVDMGFDGAGMLGAIWYSKNPVKELTRSQELLKVSVSERATSEEAFGEKASLSA